MHTGENLFKLYYLWKDFCYILSGKGTSVNSFILQSIPMYSRLKVNQQTHNRDKPFKCVLCEEAFTVSSELSIHERTYTGEKPYRCNLCEKAFRQFSISERTFKLILEKNQKDIICEKFFIISSQFLRETLSMYDLWEDIFCIFSIGYTFTNSCWRKNF